MWQFNETLIESLTEDQILEAATLNLAKSDSLNPIDRIDQLLAGVEFNHTSGQVIKATALMNIWLLKQNATSEENEEVIDESALDWELRFIEEILPLGSELVPEGLSFDVLAERSYEDGVEESVNNNFTMMFGGFTMIFFYICIR